MPNERSSAAPAAAPPRAVTPQDPARGHRRRRWAAVAVVAVAAAGIAAALLLPPLPRAALGLGAAWIAAVAAPAVALRGWWRLAGGLAGLVLYLVVLGALVRACYGGGAPYPDTSTPPLVAPGAVEVAVELPFPPGNVAIAPGAAPRVFFNYHPFALAQRFADATLFELVGGAPVPFPDQATQAQLQGVFGMTVDRQGRLWLVEPAGLDHERTRVLAFDLTTRARVVEHWFPPGEARFAQDLRVAPDGRTVYLADTGLFRFTPAALIVLDVATGRHHRVLEGHASTSPQEWVIRTPRGPHKLAYGLITFAVGVDGIELSPDGAWLYFAAMSHGRLYRVPTAGLRDPARAPAAVAAEVVDLGVKPLSDGIALDREGRVLITAIEHGGLARLGERGELTTVFALPGVVWPDGVAVASDGAILMTDSAIPVYLDQLARPPSRAALARGAPYRIYRVRAP